MNKVNLLFRIWNNWKPTIGLSIFTFIFTWILLHAQLYGPVAIIMVMGSPLIALGVFCILDWVITILLVVAGWVMRINKERM